MVKTSIRWTSCESLVILCLLRRLIFIIVCFSLFFIGYGKITSAPTGDLKDFSKEVAKNEAFFRANWMESGFDKEVQDVFLEKMARGELPDSANPEVEPIKTEVNRVNGKVETRYYYEDGTYEIVTEEPIRGGNLYDHLGSTDY